MTKIRQAIIGFGQIARQQHLHAIRSNPSFELHACASLGPMPDDLPLRFYDYREMLERLPELDAVSICTPPQVRYEIARAALLAGKHVLLEKPPTTSPSELADLAGIAAQHGRTLFTAWHSLFNDAVARAKALVSGRTLTAITVTWREDVTRTHLDQDWIWQADGPGVFDFGINALAILCHILPGRIRVRAGSVSIPTDRQAPVAADVDFSCDAIDRGIRATFDWRWADEQVSTIRMEARDGSTLEIADGGARLLADGKLDAESHDEYPSLYVRFAELIMARQSHVDSMPLRLAHDVIAGAQRIPVAPFHWR
jgi:D-galactose 1-dehydrogenase